MALKKPARWLARCQSFLSRFTTGSIRGRDICSSRESSRSCAAFSLIRRLRSFLRAETRSSRFFWAFSCRFFFPITILCVKLGILTVKLHRQNISPVGLPLPDSLLIRLIFVDLIEFCHNLPLLNPILLFQCSRRQGDPLVLKQSTDWTYAIHHT